MIQRASISRIYGLKKGHYKYNYQMIVERL